MGRSTTTVGGPAMCYNAADHYRLGWYNGKRQDVGNGPWTGTIGAFVFSQQSSNPVVIRVSGNVYFQYNLAQAHNSGTRAMKNQVVIVKLQSNGHTEAQRGLSQGESWTDPSTGVRIQVCTLGQRDAKVSVNSDCGSVSAGGGNSFTSSSAAWGSNNNNNGAWTTPSTNIFRPAPSPSFSAARPTPSFGWNTPSVSNVFSSFFNAAPKPAPQWNDWSSSARSSPSSSTWNLSWARGEVDDRR